MTRKQLTANKGFKEMTGDVLKRTVVLLIKFGGRLTVSVSHKYNGQKIGTTLPDKLIFESENEKLWTLQAGIFPENSASLKIHEELGFRKIGIREKIGKMNGMWRDAILLERRSKVIGID
ncbi:MAG: GNAT family N-acetyltransferase [Saprospiraceae bacterium]|nr:GNAT family N-acetyltransferase [Saprospiraceae bacterium]